MSHSRPYKLCVSVCVCMCTLRSKVGPAAPYYHLCPQKGPRREAGSQFTSGTTFCSCVPATPLPNCRHCSLQLPLPPRTLLVSSAPILRAQASLHPQQLCLPQPHLSPTSGRCQPRPTTPAAGGVAPTPHPRCLANTSCSADASDARMTHQMKEQWNHATLSRKPTPQGSALSPRNLWFYLTRRLHWSLGLQQQQALNTQ